MGLLERGAELAAIGAAVEGARTGHGGVLVVEGAAGIGKSSLLATAACDGTRVLRARAVPLEQTYAFGVVRTLFEPLRGDGSWAELTADAARLALPALDPAAALTGPGEEARHAALHGLTWLAANLAAETPLLIVVDDVHWADAPSLRWLAHLARRITSLRVLALLAVRTGEPPSAPAVLDDVVANAHVIRLAPLAPASTAALVRTRLRGASADVCTACHEATGGNPFLVDALAGALAEADDARAAPRAHGGTVAARDHPGAPADPNDALPTGHHPAAHTAHGGTVAARDHPGAPADPNDAPATGHHPAAHTAHGAMVAARDHPGAPADPNDALTTGHARLADVLGSASAAPSHGLPFARFGPEAVARDVARRLDRLGQGAREVALAVAILGPGAAPRLVAALSDVPREAAAAAADALRAADVLAPGARLEFAHPILAAAVAAQLGPGETAVWHRRAWQLLHADGAAPERQALHLLHVEPEGDADAVASLRAAARAAVARGAADTAATYLRRALDEPPDPAERPAVLLECGLALAAHRHREAPRLLREAITLTANPGRRAEAALQAAQALALAALYDDMIAISRLALEDTGDASAEVVARLEAELVGLGLTRAEAIPDCHARVDRARRDPPAVELWRINAAGLDTFAGVPAHVPLADLHRPELDGERSSLVGTVVRGLMLIYNDDLEAALAHCETLLEDARPRGWASAVANASWLRAMAALRLGRVGDAVEDARVAYEFKLEVGSPPDSLAWAAGPFADALLERGEPDAADEVLERLGVDALAPGVLTRPIVLESRARLRLAQQRPEEALRDAHAAAASWAPRNADGPGIVGWRLCAVEALVALGRREEASALAAEQRTAAERHDTATSRVAALRAIAMAARPDEAVSVLEDAVTVAEQLASPRTGGDDNGRAGPADAERHHERAAPADARRRDGTGAPADFVRHDGPGAPNGTVRHHDLVAPVRLEHLRALLDLGAARRRCGQLDAARDPLRTALHHADRGGATRIAERARAELVAAGARPRRAALSGLDALTAAERRVATLAAEGRTNRQIAQALFVTQRTVETHLTHTFAKLDLASRDELAAALWPAAAVSA